MRRPKPIGYALIEAKKGKARRPFWFVGSLFRSFQVCQKRSHVEEWARRRGGGCMILPVYAGEPELPEPVPTKRAPTEMARAPEVE
jgi:hypothetical protein